MSRRAWFSRLLRPRLLQEKNGTAGRKTPAYHPGVETLEDRWLPSATPVHLYALTGSLADQMGGAALTADGGTLVGGRYVFDANQGLRLTGGLADTTNYSVVLDANLNFTGSYYKKLIDFHARTTDDGLYVSGSNLQVYPGPSGTGIITSNQDFQVALTRDGASGATSVYLNGVLQQTYFGVASNVAIPSTNVLTFLQGDLASRGFEAAPGSVDYIAVYGRALTAGEVTALANSPTANQASVTVNEGQTATNTGSWIDAVSLSASVGTVTQNSDGSWSWSFAATDGPEQSQPVTITATDDEGATATNSFPLTVNDLLPTVRLSDTSIVTDGYAYTMS